MMIKVAKGIRKWLGKSSSKSFKKSDFSHPFPRVFRNFEAH